LLRDLYNRVKGRRPSSSARGRAYKGRASCQQFSLLHNRASRFSDDHTTIHSDQYTGEFSRQTT